MAIKYDTKTGKTKSNMQARGERDHYKKSLSKLGCPCKTKPKATLDWIYDKEYGAILEIKDCCCEDFEQKLRKVIFRE
jgi:hypothetical protein